MRFSSRIARSAAVGALTAAALTAAAGSAAAGTGGGGPGRTLVVAHRGPSASKVGACATAPYATIGAAVSAANPGDTVLVCPGTYPEDVWVSKAISLVGNKANINATGLLNGILISSSHVTVSGFTVTGALTEGILAEPYGPLNWPHPPPITEAGQARVPITNVSIENNIVNANDQGGDPITHQCAPPLYEGDCGGGLHLNTVANSLVRGNVVINNDDGILVTDDVGPTHGNTIADNYVAHNIYECGIVLPSHNPFSVTATSQNGITYTVGAPTPATGGIFGNLVINNSAIDNGSVVVPPFGGAGSGIGIFAPGPGMASYDNTVAGNVIRGSGQAGFTIHAHYTGGEYVSGNQVLNNTFGTNNNGGDGLDGPGTDPDFLTTAVLVFSAEPTTIAIAGNKIQGDHTGVWLSANIAASGLGTNVITGAAAPVYVSHVPYAFSQPIDTTAATATVGVLVVPNGLSTEYFVEYGTTNTPYAMHTAVVTGLTGTAPVLALVNLPGLVTGTTYHFQVVATNGAGTTQSGDQVFTAT